MKLILKIFCLFFAFLFPLSSIAIEEVVLDIDGDVHDTIFSRIDDNEWYFDMEGKNLQEKFDEIARKEITDTSKSYHLLEEILTKKFKSSPIDTMQVFAYYRGNLGMNFNPDDNDLGYEFNDIDTGIKGRFKDGKTLYEARLRFTPHHEHKFLQFMPSNFYIANTSIPNNTIIIGNTRTATGYEGSKSSTVIPFVARSQISRNFGNTRHLGLRLKGNYDLIEYDLGGYSSDTYFEQFFPGAEFAGWVTLKPLAKTKNKYGNLKLGTGWTTGSNSINYNVIGAYAGYEYKNFHANFEYGKADGYNGAKGLSSNKAEGFYTTLGYKITPKIELVTRYDQYKPNLDYSADVRREYSAGINYFLKGQAVKMMLNYMYCQNEISDDSHRIILGTQFVL